jgi:rSAM/selenodomain-associated transferase 1
MEKDQDLAGWTLPVRSLRKTIITIRRRMRTIHRVLDPERPDTSNACHCALALMTKAPRAGKVKTRLVPPLMSEEAAQLNKCFLRDTAAAISACCRSVNAQESGQPSACGVAVYTPVGAESDYRDILPMNFSLLPQRGQDFGERLFFAAADLFKCGFKTVCLIDSDSPTIPPGNFVRAVEILSSPDDCIALGPCDDGGYYLIGLKQLRREVFEGIDWSTDRVFEQTKQQAARIGIDVRELPLGFDVDDHATLRRLCDELLSENASDNVAPDTQEFLRKLVAGDGQRRIWESDVRVPDPD